MTKKPKLSDIATICGVGVSTVSRVLNKVDKGFSVKPEIRDRIQAVAKELNYSPNAAAKNLRSQKTNLVLVYGYKLKWSVYGGFYINMLNYAVAELEKQGYETHIVIQSPKNKTMLPMMMDGALTITGDDETILKELEDKGIPCVIMNDIASETKAWVGTDDVAGMNDVLNYLYDLGHRKIVYWGENDKFAHQHHHSIKDRYNTYIEFMEQKGLTPWCEFAVDAHSEKQVAELIDKIDKATAIIAYDQFMAKQIYEGFMAKGIRLPEDKSLICFGEIYEKTSYPSQISCSNIPLEKMGIKAAEILLNKMNDHNYNENVIFKQALNVKRTTGKVK